MLLLLLPFFNSRLAVATTSVCEALGVKPLPRGLQLLLHTVCAHPLAEVPESCPEQQSLLLREASCPVDVDDRHLGNPRDLRGALGQLHLVARPPDVRLEGVAAKESRVVEESVAQSCAWRGGRLHQGPVEGSLVVLVAARLHGGQ